MPRTAPAPALPSVLTGDAWPATQRGTMTAQPADVEVYPPDHPQLREAWQAGHTAGTIEQADRQTATVKVGGATWAVGDRPALLYLTASTCHRVDAPFPQAPPLTGRDRALLRALLQQGLADLDAGS